MKRRLERQCEGEERVVYSGDCGLPGWLALAARCTSHGGTVSGLMNGVCIIWRLVKFLEDDVDKGSSAQQSLLRVLLEQSF